MFTRDRSSSIASSRYFCFTSWRLLVFIFSICCTCQAAVENVLKYWDQFNVIRKDLFEKYGLPISPRKVFNKDSLSEKAISEIGSPPFVVKAQIHAGGRGKAGGVKIVKTASEAFKAAKAMIGTKMATYQTAGIAKPVDSVLIEVSRKIKKELYFCVCLQMS